MKTIVVLYVRSAILSPDLLEDFAYLSDLVILLALAERVWLGERFSILLQISLGVIAADLHERSLESDELFAYGHHIL